MRTFLAPLLAIFIFTRCDKEELPAAKSGKLNQEVEIALNETLELTTTSDNNTDTDKVRVHLAEINESRCPKNVNCIRYGNAIIRLWLEKDQERSDTAALVIGEALPTDTRKLRLRSADTTLVTVANTQYQVILTSVLPYPCTSCPAQGEQHANIIVTAK
ncbi:hypothetical protein [Adhaeribacter radiodurans]|uniref:Uncharacterized protein n=1 Tax=Adhaeribacter radiodurans TaxID=2745197 RepID=A0A7L7LD81_9BACT|nr:hypothetical protein [Adhaeribacter radiodurans]QMU30806.1 hypothetical protein HUW48_23470 [Adhaeribacter radiodurans]